MEDRLQKIIARAGIASRRAAEEIILAGRVRVNGRVANELGMKADPFKDRIEVDGTRLVAEEPHYLVLHKPRNVVSTLKDPEGRPTVGEYFKQLGARVYPIGRLDFATSGVLLVTNDGELANALLHPRGGVPKTYVMKVQGVLGDEDIEPWRKGVMLEDGLTLPANARIIRIEGDKTWLEVTLREGRNQQIRRMGEATGHRVMRLARTVFASVTSEGLRPGEWRPLTRDELLALRAEFGVPKRIRAAANPESPTATGRPWAKSRRPRGAPRSVDEGAGAQAETRPSPGARRPRPERGRPERGRPERGRSERGRPERGRPEAAKAAEPSRPPRGAAPSPTTREPTTRSARSGRSDRSGTTPRGAAPRDPRARGRGGR